MPPDQQPADPAQDQDFLKASPSDQHAYLLSSDPDYAKASPQDQQKYLEHVQPKTGLEKQRTEGDRGFWSGALHAVGLDNPVELAKSTLRRAAFAGFDPMSDINAIRSLPGNVRAGAASAAEVSPKDMINQLAGKAIGGLTGGLGTGIGVSAESQRERAEKADTAGILGEATPPAAMAIAGEALRTEPGQRVARTVAKPFNAVGDLATNALSRLRTPEAQKAMTQAIQPGVNVPRAQESIGIAGPRMQQIREAGNIQIPDKGPEAIKATLDLNREAKTQILKAIEDRLGPVAEQRPNTGSVAKAIRGAVDDITMEEPGVREAVERSAGKYEGESRWTLRQLEDRMHTLNNRLGRVYSRPNMGDGTIPVSAELDLAEAGEVRKLIDDSVERLSGEGVKDLKREYGAQRDVEKGLARQYAVATRVKGAPLWEGLAYLQAAGDLVSGGVWGAAKAAGRIAVGNRLQALRDPGYLLNQSFHGKNAFEAAPEIPAHGGPPPPAGLLPPPATPLGGGGPDTSGSVRGGRYTTPAALIPQETREPVNAEFVPRRMPPATRPKALLGTGEAPTRPPNTIPPAVSPEFANEAVGKAASNLPRRTNPNALGTEGTAAVRTPPGSRQLPAPREGATPPETPKPPERFVRPPEPPKGAGKEPAPAEMHPEELAEIRKEAGRPNMTAQEAQSYRINKVAVKAAETKPTGELGGMKRAGAEAKTVPTSGTHNGIEYGSDSFGNYAKRGEYKVYTKGMTAEEVPGKLDEQARQHAEIKGRFAKEAVKKAGEEPKPETIREDPEYKAAKAAEKAVKDEVGNRLIGGANTKAQKAMESRVTAAEDKVADAYENVRQRNLREAQRINAEEQRKSEAAKLPEYPDLEKMSRADVEKELPQVRERIKNLRIERDRLPNDSPGRLGAMEQLNREYDRAGKLQNRIEAEDKEAARAKEQEVRTKKQGGERAVTFQETQKARDEWANASYQRRAELLKEVGDADPGKTNRFWANLSDETRSALARTWQKRAPKPQTTRELGGQAPSNFSSLTPSGKALAQKEFYKTALQKVSDAWEKKIGAEDMELAERATARAEQKKHLTGQPAREQDRLVYLDRDKPEGFPEDRLHIKVPGDGEFNLQNRPGVLARMVKLADEMFGKGERYKPERYSRTSAKEATPKQLQATIKATEEEIARVEGGGNPSEWGKSEARMTPKEREDWLAAERENLATMKDHAP